MDPKELSKQLMRPTGKSGLEVANAMNESNRKHYESAFSMLDFQADQNVLEIGFGNGNHFNNYFELESGLNVTGVDYSKDMCAEANTRNAELIKKGKLSIHCAKTDSLPFEDSSFDLIIALNVIYFLDPPAPNLSEIKRVLKDSGTFLIGYRPKHSVAHFDFTKQNFILYEEDELLTLLESNGFSVESSHINTSSQTLEDDKEFTVKDAVIMVKKIFKNAP
jgi:SAM-dependent methyltransferase